MALLSVLRTRYAPVEELPALGIVSRTLATGRGPERAGVMVEGVLADGARVIREHLDLGMLWTVATLQGALDMTIPPELVEVAV